MENTVTINLNLYNELRDFKNNIEAGKIGSRVFNSSYTEYLNADEAMKKIVANSDVILKESERIAQNNFQLKMDKENFVKKTTLWQFYKLKRKK